MKLEQVMRESTEGTLNKYVIRLSLILYILRQWK